jgi:hypothetical protein
VTDSLSRHALDILWFRPYPTAFFINSNSLVRKVWDKIVDEEVRAFLLFYKNNKKDLLLLRRCFLPAAAPLIPLIMMTLWL